MLKLKNVKGSPVTTIIGILIPVVLTLLVAFGVITADQQGPLGGLLDQLVDAIEANKLASIVSLLTSIVLIFIKDPKLKKKQ